MAGYGRVGRRAQTDEPASARRHPPSMRMRARALLPLSRSPERPWTGRVAREYSTSRVGASGAGGRYVRGERAERHCVGGLQAAQL